MIILSVLTCWLQKHELLEGFTKEYVPDWSLKFEFKNI